MTNQEILAAFIQAEKDWSAPIEKASENCTRSGLCRYFRWIGFYKEQISEIRMLWEKHKTKGPVYDFHGYGDEPRGRSERQEAIRKVINDLKKES